MTDSSLPRPAVATPSHVPPLRWGVWGTGGIAARFATDLRTVPGSQVVAVASRTLAKAQAFATAHGVATSYEGLAALLADPAVDAVYVATPHPDHAPAALAAIAAAKPVLVEKPFAMDAAEAATIAAAAAAAGVFCMEAMWTRWLPHMVRVRELIAAGTLGEIVAVQADHGQRFPRDAGHRLYAPALGGGALLDLGVYPVSFASMVLGPPVAMSAQGSPAFTGVDASDAVVLGYASGAKAVLHTTLSASTPCRAWIAGTEGTIDIDPVWYTPTGFTLRTADGRTERFEADDDARRGGLGFEAAEVARCLGAGLTESPVLPLAETVAVMEHLDRIRRITGVSTHPV